jgi:hypothetical protein
MRRGLQQERYNSDPAPQHFFLVAFGSVLQIAKLRAQVSKYTCGQVRPVEIRSQSWTLFCDSPQYGNFIRGNPRSDTADCHDPEYTFERGA